MTTLIIVESSGKIKKIESILGTDYKVIASIGHIIDLNKSNMSIEIDNNFTPIYICSPDKSKVINNILDNIKKCDNILLASDEDREGEMIAWSIKYVTELKNKTLFKNKVQNCKRITFNSITKTELKKAIDNPREIDINLVHAQQARRILDRLVGYEISPLLMSLGQHNSAGRVQSVVVKIIIDREKEIEEYFKNALNENYTITMLFNDNLSATLYEDNEKAEINNLDKTKELILLIANSVLKVMDISTKEKRESASPPYTTSTLQQDAGNKLGFNVKRTMTVAQKLYEKGYITYMRTDSTNLSSDAIENIKNYIIKKYGITYYQHKLYNKHVKNTQEAHEACRVTDVNTESIDINSDENRLYNLIWKRTVACQMKPALYDVIDIDININNLDIYTFKSTNDILKFLGYLIIYGYEIDKNTVKYPIIGDKININELNGIHNVKKPPTRYNEVSLVNKLDPKHLNIGRPATYASIIGKIQERKYIIIGDNKGSSKELTHVIWKNKELSEEKKTVFIGKDTNKLVPTELGKKVNEYLTNNFIDIMDYKFTARMEDELDKIASGELIWYNVVNTFYKDFHPLIIKLKTTPLISEKNIIGIYNKKNIELVKFNNDNNIKYVMKYNKIWCDIDCDPTELTEEHAIELLTEKLKYPITLGTYNDKEIYIKKGRFGLYLEYNKTNISINKKTSNDEDITNENLTNENLTLDKAIELIKEKTSNIFNTFTDKHLVYKVLTGKFGPYINVYNTKTKKGFNKKILIKKYDPKTLNFEDIKNILNKTNDKDKLIDKDKPIDKDKVIKKDKANKKDKAIKKYKTSDKPIDLVNE